MRPGRRCAPAPRAVLALLILAAGLGGSAPLRADEAGTQPASPAPQGSAQRLQQVESALKQGQAENEEIAARADAAAKDAETVRQDMVGAAGAVQDHEAALADLQTQLGELDQLAADKRRDLDLKRQQANGALTALLRLAVRPTEALIGQPTSPTETVRSAILLRDVLPRLEAQAAEIKADIDALARLRAQAEAQKRKFAAETASLDADRKRLAALYDRKAQLKQQTDVERLGAEQKVAALAAEAQDLRDLVARLDEQRARERATAAASSPPKRPAESGEGKPFSEAQGQMPLPARGRISIHFGQPTESGMTAKGITIETQPGAQVVAPYDGRVAFAGPFRGYGLLLIIEHGEGYHTLLAGMARIDSGVGQSLVAGEPVGVMDQAEDKPLLYVELRRNGQPINPLPWLTARKTKVSG